MIIQKKIFFIFCLFIFVKYKAQESKRTDSIKECYLNSTNNANKLKELRILTTELQDVSEFDTSNKYATIGLEIATQLGDSFYIQKFYGRLGVSAWNQGNFTKALGFFDAGLKFCRLEEEVGAFYNNSGLVYWDQGELPKALKYFLKSYDIDKKYKNIDGMSSSLLNIGLIYDDLSDYRNALKYYYSTNQLFVDR